MDLTELPFGPVGIAMPETALGLFPDVGGSYLLANCPQPYGIYWALTGKRMNVSDALKMEWIDKAIAVEDTSTFYRVPTYLRFEA